MRIAGAVILGIVVGGILFAVVALIIGALNNMLGMNIPVSLEYRENVWSLALLVALELVSIGAFVWMVLKSPPPAEESQEEETGEEDETE
jgi:hypothetical protein